MRTLVNEENVTVGDGEDAVEIDLTALIADPASPNIVRGGRFQYTITLLHEGADGDPAVCIVPADIVPTDPADLTFSTAHACQVGGRLVSLPMDYDPSTGTLNPWLRAASSTSVTYTVDIATGSVTP